MVVFMSSFFRCAICPILTIIGARPDCSTIRLDLDFHYLSILRSRSWSSTNRLTSRMYWASLRVEVLSLTHGFRSTRTNRMPGCSRLWRVLRLWKRVSRRAEKIELHIKLCLHLYTFLNVAIKATMLAQRVILKRELNIINLVTAQSGQLRDYP